MGVASWGLLVLGLMGAPEDDIELSAEEMELLRELQEESGEGAEEQPSLRIYGFSDILVGGAFGLGDTAQAVTEFPSQPNNVVFGNLNVYLDANLTHGFRSLAEVRFHFAPVGSRASPLYDGTANPYSESISSDPTSFGRDFQYGYIEIERAYIEYEAAGWFTARIGRFLTPYGIWNVDHGTPVILTTRRPFVIDESLFPERQTGLELFGRVVVGPGSLGYHAYLTNGRGPIEAVRDVDDDLSFGGRLYWDTSEIGRLRIGGSIYWGTFTDERFTVDADALLAGETALRPYERTHTHELSLAADLRWQIEGWTLQSELVTRQLAYEDDKRPYHTSGTAPDRMEIGVYGLLAYEIADIATTPFLYFEYLDWGYERYGGLGIVSLAAFGGGFRFRLLPGLVAKLSAIRSLFPNAFEDTVFEDGYLELVGQVAWAF